MTSMMKDFLYLSRKTDKHLIETILGNIIETNIVVTRKTPKGLDSFQTLEVFSRASS